MTLSDLQNLVKKDLKIQGDELSYESLRTPEIHNSYNKLLMSERLALKKLEREWDILYLSRWEYYRKKAPEEEYFKKPLLKKILDSDVKLYLAADEELQELRGKIDGKEELIDFLKRVMDQISSRQWIIRNAIENMKYLSGGKPVD
jgi:Recombination, repair and ssDNA binding protein UvsY